MGTQVHLILRSLPLKCLRSSRIRLVPQPEHKQQNHYQRRQEDCGQKHSDESQEYPVAPGVASRLLQMPDQ